MISNLFAFPVTYLILISTFVISLLALYRDESLVDKFILHPFGMIRRGEYYRMFTYSFLHADLMHLFFNMISFYSFARTLEIYLGSLKFFLLYFISVILSVVTTVQNNQYNPGYRSLGASGGVSGVIFSFIVFEPMSRLGILFIPIPLPAYIFGLVYLGFSYYAANQDDQINHDAHFYGAITGALLTFVFEPATFSRVISLFR